MLSVRLKENTAKRVDKSVILRKCDTLVSRQNGDHGTRTRDFFAAINAFAASSAADDRIVVRFLAWTLRVTNVGPGIRMLEKHNALYCETNPSRANGAMQKQQNEPRKVLKKLETRSRGRLKCKKGRMLSHPAFYRGPSDPFLISRRTSRLLFLPTSPQASEPLPEQSRRGAQTLPRASRRAHVRGTASSSPRPWPFDREP